MQMTHEVRVKVAVQEALAGQIIERLQKLGASEEKELRTGFSKMPARVYETTIERLATMKLIRRVRSRDGIVFVAKARASKEDLANAARRYRKVRATTEWRLYARKMMELEGGIRMQAKNAATVEFPEFPDECIYPADEQAFLDAFDWKAYAETDVPERHLSEGETFGLSYETVAAADYRDAFIPFDSDAAQAASLHNRELVAEKPIGEYQQSLVERQIRTGQGRRNAKRARNRYYERDELGRSIKAVREMQEAEIRKERAALNR